ncbi:MAG: NfeD family protein, partial [Candidatus Binatia bacterium]
VNWAAEAVRESASITSDKALEKQVIDLIAGSREELMNAADGRTVKIRGQDAKVHTAEPEFRDVEMTLEQRFYFFLSQPTVIFLLMVAGAGALYVEFTQPGVIAPGVIGAICLVLASIGFSIVPINLTGAALLGLGVALLIAEVFVPSFGALGVGGFLCFITGSVLLFQTVEAPGLTINPGVIAATSVGFAALLLGVGTLVARAQRRPVATGREAMIGQRGVVLRPLTPRGKARVMGEVWDVVFEGEGSAAEGTEVEVVRVEGLKLIVSPVRRS